MLHTKFRGIGFAGSGEEELSRIIINIDMAAILVM